MTEKEQTPSDDPGREAPLRLIPVGAVVVRVPPQTDELLFATVSPAGSGSVKATPFRPICELLLVIVKVNVLVALSAMVIGLKALAMTGGPRTSMLADAVPPVPASVEVTFPEMLCLVPAVVPVTLTVKLQEPLAGRLEPVRLTLLPPAVAVLEPVQVPPTAGGVATTRPAGSVSMKPTPVSATVLFGFPIRKVSDVVPPTAIVGAPNDLPIEGGATTVSDALETLPGPPSVEVTWTALFLTPAVVPVTLTEIVQTAPPGNVPSARLTVEEPATALMVPAPQLPLRPLDVATTRPAGKLSVKPTPLRLNAAI